MAKFNILNKAEELTNYVLTVVENSPKKIRLDIVPELRKKVLEITENVVQANHYAINGENATEKSVLNRQQYQEQCLIVIDVLNSFLEIACKHNYITSKQLENSTKLSSELYDMIRKWKDRDAQRVSITIK